MIELYTPKQAAEKLNVTVVTLWRWRKLGLISARVRGRWIRYTDEDLQKFVDESKVEGPQKAIKRHEKRDRIRE